MCYKVRPTTFAFEPQNAKDYQSLTCPESSIVMGWFRFALTSWNWRFLKKHVISPWIGNEARKVEFPPVVGSCITSIQKYEFNIPSADRGRGQMFESSMRLVSELSIYRPNFFLPLNLCSLIGRWHAHDCIDFFCSEGWNGKGKPDPKILTFRCYTLNKQKKIVFPIKIFDKCFLLFSHHHSLQNLTIGVSPIHTSSVIDGLKL